MKIFAEINNVHKRLFFVISWKSVFKYIFLIQFKKFYAFEKKNDEFVPNTLP